MIVDRAGSILLILGGGFTNTESGTIQVTNGATVEFEQANFTNKGTFSVHNGIFDVGILDIGAGTLTGSGTINGNLTLDSDPSTLAFNISGETQGADYDSLTINGTTILAGDLQLTLTNGFFPLPTDIFTVLNVDSSDILTGAHVLNVANGGAASKPPTAADHSGSPLRQRRFRQRNCPRRFPAKKPRLNPRTRLHRTTRYAPHSPPPPKTPRLTQKISNHRPRPNPPI